MSVPAGFPFTRLRVSEGETVLWCGHNPTFHRFVDYGLAVTDRAFYLCRRSWWRLAYWRRIPLADIASVELLNGDARPGLQIQCHEGAIHFHTPFDFYRDEMEFDRTVLEKAIGAIRDGRKGASGP